MGNAVQKQRQDYQPETLWKSLPRVEAPSPPFQVSTQHQLPPGRLPGLLSWFQAPRQGSHQPVGFTHRSTSRIGLSISIDPSLLLNSTRSEMASSITSESPECCSNDKS